jgi:midasin (ATPase involved in ribosome maturation)
MSLVVDSQIAQRHISRDNFIFAAKGLAAVKETSLTTTNRSKTTELTNLCLLLHTLAQKYVPNTPQAFSDFDALLQVTHALRQLGIQPILTAKIKAAAVSTDNSAVLNSQDYRNLRNKAIAALATIADFTGKNTPPGSADYQNGVREGYRRASDVAILFLEDIQNGVA